MNFKVFNFYRLAENFEKQENIPEMKINKAIRRLHGGNSNIFQYKQRKQQTVRQVHS